MSKIIIGIDPDSKAHGVAFYVDGRLDRLECLSLYWLMDAVEFYHGNDMEIHIEDVCANNAIFRGGNGVKVQQSIARRLGMVQQSQVELERFMHQRGIRVIKHKISKMWKKDRKQFEKVTGWKSQSNEDTRSAAYFGWLGCK